MSGRALGWAKRQHAPDRDTKALLVFLADYVQDQPFAWPAVSTVAGELQCSERTVQRMLPQLVAAGLLVAFECTDKATNRTRTRVYYFPVELDLPTPAQIKAFELNAGCRLAQLSPCGRPLEEGDSRVTGSVTGAVTGEGDSRVTGGVTTESPLKELNKEPSEADAYTRRERVLEVEIDRFAEAWAAYPDAGRLGVSSERMGRQAWAEELAGGADPARILAGIAAYAGNRAVWGASGRPKAFHRFLSGGCWIEFADLTPATPSSSCSSSWSGPAEFRAVVVASKGEAWARSWLDPATWNGQAVVAARRIAARELREVLRGQVEVLDPS
jgi:hypothetical protein